MSGTKTSKSKAKNATIQEQLGHGSDPLDNLKELGNNLSSNFEVVSEQNVPKSILGQANQMEGIIFNEGTYDQGHTSRKPSDQASKRLATESKSKFTNNYAHIEEEVKEYGNNLAATASKTLPSFSISGSVFENTSKKRPREEISGQMSFYDDYIQRQHELTDTREQAMRRVHTRELEQHIKSKKQMYSCLTLEAQIYLPPYNECNVAFMHQIMTGSKKFFRNNEIKVVKVPQFLELSASRVFIQAMALPKFAAYLPQYDHERPINRTYLFNVINTIDHEFFEKNIPEAFQIRLEAHGEKHQKNVEILPFFYNVITQSKMISNDNKRGKAFAGLGKAQYAKDHNIQAEPVKKQRAKPEHFDVKYKLGGGRTLGQRTSKAFHHNQSAQINRPALSDPYANMQQQFHSAEGNASKNSNALMYAMAQAQQQPQIIPGVFMNQTQESQYFQSSVNLGTNSADQPQQQQQHQQQPPGNSPFVV